MPLEETSWALLIIAAIAQRQGGDLSWLVPYWPAVSTWYNFLITLLPFPQNQLSTGESRERIPTSLASASPLPPTLPMITINTIIYPSLELMLHSY